MFTQEDIGAVKTACGRDSKKGDYWKVVATNEVTIACQGKWGLRSIGGVMVTPTR